MSSTNRTPDLRRAGDFYETPDKTIDTAIDIIDPPRNWRILDPMAGHGAIMRRLIERGHPRELVHGIELDPERAAVARGAGLNVEQGDSNKLTAGDYGAYDLVKTNPAFNVSMMCAQQSLNRARKLVCLLLPINWLGTEGRASFHRAHPADIYTIPRPAFAASISCKDRVNCGWRVLLEIDEPWPRVCPQCGAKTSRTTTDSIEYAWWLFGDEEVRREIADRWAARHNVKPGRHFNAYPMDQR